ncbi:MAG: hypothetical protein ACI3XQ_12420 [Eubacteriales bacterium]
MEIDMRLIKKELCLLLALLMLIPASFGCKKKEGDGQTESVQMTDTSGETTVAEKTFNDLEAVDFGGSTFNILTRDSESTVLWRPIDWYSETLLNETIPDAVYNRNKLVENKYNCKIAQIMNKDYLDAAFAAYMSGDGDYDVLVMPFVQQINSLAIGGYLYDFNDIDTVNLDDPWWDQYTNDSLSLLGHHYTICGDINIIDDMATWCVLFNQPMVEDYGLDDNYQLVRDGKWTLEQMYTCAKAVANPELSMYGIATEVEAAMAYLGAANTFTFVKDSDGVPVNNMKSRNFLDKIEGVYDKMRNRNLQVYGDNDTDFGVNWGELYNIFKNDQSLYCTCTLSTLLGDQISNMATLFGILPIPKYDEAAEGYISTLQPGNATGVSILANSSNAEEVGTLLSAMSAASVDTLTEAFYDKTLERRKVRDEESYEMLQIIFEHREIDIGFVFSSTARKIITQTIKAQDGFQFVSIRSEYIDMLEDELDKVVEGIRNNFNTVADS